MYARVVVDVGPAHLDRLFDYRIPDGADVGVGSRVQVTFNGRRRTAWVAEVAAEPATEAERVRDLDRVDGDVRWFGEEDLRVWRWVADRYAGTLAGAIRHALPPRVVRVEREAASWGPPRMPQTGDTPDRTGEAASDGGGPAARPPCAGEGWRELAGSALLKAAWEPAGAAFHLRAPLHPPEGEGPLLADLVARCAAAGRQALVVVPSPAAGPADDIIAALGAEVADLRGEQPEADRYRAFLRARRGDVSAVVGERGIVLMPLARPGLLVVVDEASPALKERRNPRHHVREAALARARIVGATAVLTSSVLSAQARRHAAAGHLRLVRADRVVERSRAPQVDVVDRMAQTSAARRTRLAAPVGEAITRVVGGGGLVILLAGARGTGSSLACAACRTRLECPVCGGGISAARGSAPATSRGSAPATSHGSAPATSTDELRSCGSCGWAAPAAPCPECGATETVPLRAGAARFASELARSHPDAQVAHMEGFDQPGPDRRPAIAVLTRGSVVPRPSWLGDRLADLLVIADPDTLLGRPDVEAAEDALRLWLDAARLARAVVLQTTQPTHPAIQALVRHDPDGFWDGEHARRAELGFPPAGSLIRLTSLPPEEAAAIRDAVPGTLLGPDADGAALLKTADLRGTLNGLRPLRQRWARDDVRIRVDVDPTSTT